MSTVLLQERRGRVAILTLNRTERLNAIGAETLLHLGVALTEIQNDVDVGSVVVAGAGKAFSAGADITEIGACDSPDAFADQIRRFTDTYAALQALSKPSIAAVDGIAFGGGFELALACDLRVASGRSLFGVPEIKLGLLPGAGGSQRLSRLLPPGIAKHLLLTGESMSCEDAHRLGLVNQVAEDGQSLDVAVDLATRLAELPPLALAAAKRLVDKGGELPFDSAIALERETVTMLFGTDDRAEGISAFLEKRPPIFTGS
jgi:enoyl-CoA hydratase